MSLSLGAFAEGFATSLNAQRDRKAMAEANARQDRMLDIMEKQGSMPMAQHYPMSMGVGPADTPQAGSRGGGGVMPAPPSKATGPAGSFSELLRRTEGAGDYDTLFGHSQREGGRFAGTKASNMTLDELYSFTSPKGEYGSWVASKNGGTVATPIGAGQIVGSTMRRAAKQMGLPGDTRFSPEVQDAMINHLAMNRINGVSDPAARRKALRSEWVGFNHVSDGELDGAISGLLAKNNQMGALRPAG